MLAMKYICTPGAVYTPASVFRCTPGTHGLTMDYIRSYLNPTSYEATAYLRLRQKREREHECSVHSRMLLMLMSKFVVL